MLFIKTLLLSPVLLFVHSYQGIRAMLSLTAEAIKAKGTDENTTIGVVNFVALIVATIILTCLKIWASSANRIFALGAMIPFAIYLIIYNYGQKACDKGESIMNYKGDAMAISHYAFYTLLLLLYSVI